MRVVHNGVSAAEIAGRAAIRTRPISSFVGEFRHIKGIDVLIDALAELHRSGRRVSLAIVGDGAEGPALRDQVARLGLTERVRFLGHMPARQAFALGRLLVVPSRAESLPYVVLEAGGAGIPMIATGVGGIPEIFGPEANTGAAGESARGSRRPSPRRSTIRRRMRLGADRLRERVRQAVLAGRHGRRRARRLRAKRD